MKILSRKRWEGGGGNRDTIGSCSPGGRRLGFRPKRRWGIWENRADIVKELRVAQRKTFTLEKKVGEKKHREGKMWRPRKKHVSQLWGGVGVTERISCEAETLLTAGEGYPSKNILGQSRGEGK